MVRLSKIIFFFVFGLLTTQANAKNPPPGTGTSDVPANILIMLDNSGSMSSKLYSSVQVYYPLDVATDSAGNVYGLEYYNNRILVFDSSGNYKRAFGGYGNNCSRWRFARQFVIHNDVIYIADTYGQKIKSLSLTGQCKDISFRGGTYPHAIAANNNYIFVGYNSNRMTVFDFRLNERTSQSLNNLNYSWACPLILREINLL